MTFQYPKLLLASGSPRRREILEQAGLRFEVLPVDVDESRLPQESPDRMVQRLAESKARTALRLTEKNAAARRLRGFPLLGADTIVTTNDRVLGKPSSAEDAAEMLRALAGRSHHVLTGVALLFPGNGQEIRTDVQVSTTRVDFRPLVESQIREYVSSGEPFDKAGAYGIQGLASKFVERIEGCYFNVVGLPISLVCRMIENHQAWWPPEGTTRTSPSE
jgi:septum formation protein